MNTQRRRFLVATGALGMAGVAESGARLLAADQPAAQPAAKPAAGEDVSAVEDLMREHGVLRRLLLVYEAFLRRIGGAKAEFPAAVLHEAATLVQQFVEEYHEQLEEKFIFPKFAKHATLGPLAAVLKKQHEAGRVLTDRIAQASTGTVDPRSATTVVTACREFIRMYRPHAAYEDTVLFPALHQVLSPQQVDALGDQFEAEEDRLFGEGGFERTVAKVAVLEKRLSIDGVEQFTPMVS